jgi:hypothetical protein
MEKMKVLDAILYRISWTWSSMNPITLVSSWKKLRPDLEDDLHDFHMEEISKSKILDMVCDMKSYENTDEDNIEEWLQSDGCQLGFQHMTYIINAAKKKRGRRGWGG